MTGGLSTFGLVPNGTEQHLIGLATNMSPLQGSDPPRILMRNEIKPRESRNEVALLSDFGNDHLHSEGLRRFLHDCVLVIQLDSHSFLRVMMSGL